MKSSGRWFLLFTASLLALVTTKGELYQVGDSFATFTTKDQHEQTYTFEPGVRLVVISFEMGSGKATNAFLEKQPPDFLTKNRAIFIANIYGMPGIGRVFALPKMKKYPHRILLADAEGFLARYPQQEDMLTVLRLNEQGAISAITFANPKKDLAAVFAPTP